MATSTRLARRPKARAAAPKAARTDTERLNFIVARRAELVHSPYTNLWRLTVYASSKAYICSEETPREAIDALMKMWDKLPARDRVQKRADNQSDS